MLPMKTVPVILLMSLLALSACESESVEVLKSPCASASMDGGPCGPKQPVNDWWLKPAAFQV